MQTEDIRFNLNDDKDDTLDSAVLEAELTDKQSASVFRMDGKWLVNIMTAEGHVVSVDWDTFVAMAQHFSDFVIDETERLNSRSER